jgi:hypothetical protein
MSRTVPTEQEPHIEDDGVPLILLTPEEERQLFDTRARAIMGMSGEEFLRRLDAGEFTEALAEEFDPKLYTLYTLSDLGR